MDRNATLPTSLDYINRPNPIEPQSQPHKHPLYGPSRLSSGANEDLRRLLVPERAVPSADGRPSKRRKSGPGPNDAADVNTGSLDLPKLPVRSSTKRMRIPPTLSGLHQPPPDARLLPSISVEQPPKARVPPSVEEINATSLQDTATKTTQAKPRCNSPMTGKTKRNKWSEDETAYLLKGVARLGVGNWTKILECSEYHFDCRTALDLRDRFRVCRPQDYKDPRGASSRYVIDQDSDDVARGTKSERKSSTELRALGIEQPFTKVRRRKRTKYTPSEDQMLWEGFEKHGNMWAVILDHGKDVFQSHRTATDLRDRFRTRYPERYAQTGLAPRPEVFPAPPQRQKDTKAADLQTKTSIQTSVTKPNKSTANAPDLSFSASVEESRPLLPKRAPPNSIFPYHDVFFGAPFDSAADDHEPEAQSIVLDRGILDWANEPARTNALAAELGGRTGIDPLVTLRPPSHLPHLPGAERHAANGSGGAYTNGEVLPPLAAITADGADGLQFEQLQLPSLLFDGGVDGRGAGHLMNIEDMLG
nr:telomere-associated protein 1 [Quercus suber]